MITNSAQAVTVAIIESYLIGFWTVLAVGYSGISFNHFTNWGWLIQLIVYTLSFFHHICSCCRSPLFCMVVYTWCTALLNGIVWSIAVGISVIIYCDPEIAVNSGLSQQTFYMGNTLLHYIPIILVFSFIIVHTEDITKSHTWIACRLTSLQRGWFYFIQLNLPLLFFFVYNAAFNFHQTYHTTASTSTLLWSILITNWFCNGLFILFFHSGEPNIKQNTTDQDVQHILSYQKLHDKRISAGFVLEEIRS